MKPKSNLTILATLTMLTLLIWVAIEAYQRFIKVDYGNIPAEVFQPLAPTLDKKTLDLIENRKSYTDDEISNFSLSSNASLAAEIKATPAASESIQPTLSPSPIPPAQSQ